MQKTRRDILIGAMRHRSADFPIMHTEDGMICLTADELRDLLDDEHEPVFVGLETQLDPILADLRVAIAQSLPSDDQIIMEHVRAAYEGLQAILHPIKEQEG